MHPYGSVQLSLNVIPYLKVRASPLTYFTFPLGLSYYIFFLYTRELAFLILSIIMSTFCQPMVPTRRHGPPSVIDAGLMRTGTLSMARAYDILGLRAYHGLDISSMKREEGRRQWNVLEKAAEGTWPNVPGARPAQRFKREDWDSIFGEYDAVTDVAAIFADQLVEAYPEAKVVIVQRDYEKWWASFQPQVLDGLVHSLVAPLLSLLMVIIGERGVKAMQKTLMGAFDAKDGKGIRANSRKTYFAYYDRIREIVPPERRLEYKLGQGWEPLCAFLGKDVPDVPFPNVNDRVEHRARQVLHFKQLMKECFDVLKPWLIGFFSVVMVFVAAWLSRS